MNYEIQLSRTRREVVYRQQIAFFTVEANSEDEAREAIAEMAQDGEIECLEWENTKYSELEDTEQVGQVEVDSVSDDCDQNAVADYVKLGAR